MYLLQNFVDVYGVRFITLLLAHLLLWRSGGVWPFDNFLSGLAGFSLGSHCLRDKANCGKIEREKFWCWCRWYGRQACGFGAEEAEDEVELVSYICLLWAIQMTESAESASDGIEVMAGKISSNV